MPTWIYTPSPDNSARTLLGTQGQRPLVCVGINPSTAAPGDLDRTVATVERVAERGAFDSFMMLNVYAQRATNPSDMHTAVDLELHAWNMRSIAAFVNGRTLEVWQLGARSSVSASTYLTCSGTSLPCRSWRTFSG